MKYGLSILLSINTFAGVANGILHAPMNYTSAALKQTAYVHRNLFENDTLRVFGIAAPLYVIALSIDKPLHKVFYDASHHVNTHQLTDSTINRITKLTKVGVWGYAIGGLLWPSSRHKATIFSIGYASALFCKTLLKGFEWWPAQRPYNQRFEKRRIYTGFPSGQMTQVTYLATVLGLEYGSWVGVGLGMLSGAIAGVLVGSNRHYLSQVIAGSALGISYGIATYKTIHPDKGWECGCNHAGGYFSCQF